MATQETIKQMFSGGVLRDVEDVTARQMVAALQNAIDALTSGDTTTAIETFQEVINFLEGVTDDATLIGKLNELRTLINAKYTKPANGIPASDLASGVIPDVSGFATKTEVNAKANSSDVYTKSQTDAAIEEALENMPTGDIPTKVSDLINDEGYITAAALADVIVGNGDFAMTYDQVTDTFNIVRLVPTISVDKEVLAVDDNSSKAGTISVSGTNLKADIVITAPTNWSVKVGSGTPASSVTLQQVGGVVAATEVTIAYTGSGDTASGTLSIVAGTASKSVALNYSKYGVATIIVDGSTINLSEVSGYADAYIDLAVSGVLLEGDIVASVPSGSRFSIGTDGTKSATISKQADDTASGTLRIIFHPLSGDTSPVSDTLTLTSTGANSVTISLSGTILTQSLTLTPSSLTLESEAGSTATGTINVQGSNIKGNVTLGKPSGFLVKVNGTEVSTLTKEQVNANGGVTLTISNAGVSASGNLTFSVGGTQLASAPLSWQEVEPAPAVDSYKIIDGVRYRFRSSQNNGVADNCAVAKPEGGEWAASTYAGNITIPEYITVAGNQYPIKMIDARAFYNASNLVSVDLSAASQLTNVQGYAFYGTAITELDIASGVTELANNSLQNCPSLTKLTLRYNGVVKIYGDTLGGTTQNLSEVFVPSGQIASYEADKDQYSQNTYGWRNKNVAFKPITE